jgi:hypothetical protein
LILLLVGCTVSTSTLYDFDLDGSLDESDCGPADPTVYPGADDPYGDGIDQNCDGTDGTDSDGDGYPAEDQRYPADAEEQPAWDCDDSNADVHPGAEEIANNGRDDDCRDGALEDQDGDGWGAVDDCDDNDPSTYVGAPEVADEVDNDCDGDVDEGTAGVDDDGDGFCEGADYAGTGILSCYGEAEPGDCDDTNMSLSQADADGDGYSSCGADNEANTGDEDCDEADPARNPGAAEVCDGLDNDCDGEQDEGSAAPGTWQADADLDGYGDPTSATVSCAVPPGYVALGGDCDDDNAAINPGATEICDGADTDCDGDLALVEMDLDGDGYSPCENDCDDSDAAQNLDDLDLDGSSTCQGDCDDSDATLSGIDGDADGYSTCTGDCDDSDPTRSPGTLELCDGLDNNCDGAVPSAETDGDGDLDLASPCGTDCDDNDPDLNGLDADSDGYSSCAADCDDADPTRSPGVAELCDGLDNDCDGLVPSAETDGDGDLDLAPPCGTDCDDADVAVNGVDGDSDGFSPCAGDCDDGDSTVRPGATELCDGEDNDCDGQVPAVEVDGDGDLDTPAPCGTDCDDTDPTLHGLDGDSDGFSPCAGDCDDAASTRSPGLAEICDGLDNDCDDAIPAAEFDGDGDGDLPAPCGSDCDDTDATVEGLDVDLDGFSTCDSDCDDGNSLVYDSAIELCDGVDNDCNGLDDAGSPGNGGREVDGDNDGYMLCSGDCNDADASLNLDDVDLDNYNSCTGECNDGDNTIYPFAFDAPCDGIDSDCLADPLEVDDDGDGYLDCAGYTAAQNPPPGILGGDDCDDTSTTIFSGAAEVCDGGADNDCDPTTPTAESVDADFDSHPLCGADGISGTVDDDCNDVYGNGHIHPGHPEICDGIDNDCDGVLEVAAADDDGDGQSICGGDCDDGDPTIYTGAPEIFDGKDNDCNDQADDSVTMAPGSASTVFDGANWGEQAGYEVAGVGDVDNDGLGDMLVGAPDFSCEGRIYLFLGGSLAGETQLSAATADVIFEGVGCGDDAGGVLAAAGDIDNDGFDDFMISAVNNDLAGYQSGAVYLLMGSTVDAFIQTGAQLFDLANADLTFLGEATGDAAGWSLSAAGDVEGDNLGDILIGAYSADAPNTSTQDNSGKAYLIRGSTIVSALAAGTTTFSLSQADASFLGEFAGDFAGYAVAGAGDVDNDGFDDLLVGSPHFGNAAGNFKGRAYLLLGITVRTAMVTTLGPIDLSLSSADVVLTADPLEDNGTVGYSLAVNGDIDGDGKSDLVIGAPSAGPGDPWHNGKAYLVLGSTVVSTLQVGSGIFSLAAADQILHGVASYDYAAESLAFAGDLDADGGDDLVIGAPYTGTSGLGSNVGTAYVVLSSQINAALASVPPVRDFGLASAAADLWGEFGGDRLGMSVDSAGDVNGDGKADFIIGAPWFTDSTVLPPLSRAGRAYLLLSGY